MSIRSLTLVVLFCVFAIPQSGTIQGYQNPTFITSVDWNMDGTMLGIGYDSGEYEVRDANTNQIIYQNSFVSISEISWSQTANYLALAISTGVVCIVDVNSGNLLMCIRIETDFTIDSIAWHPDGNQLAVVSRTGSGWGADYWLRIWDVSTEQLVSESLQFLATSTDWSPDGQKLVVGSHETRTVVVNAATGTPLLELSDDGTRTVAWNPDSSVNRIATNGNRGEVRVWDGQSGQMLWEVKTGRHASQFDWNSAGTQLAAASGSLLYIWDGETGNEITQFTADPALIDTVSWSPDDSKIAYGTTDGQVIILYLPIANAGPDQTIFTTSGQAPVTLDGSDSTDPDGTIVSYEWSENGNVIATGAAPQVTLSVGTHTLTLKVTDNDGLVTTDDVVITVESGTAPTATSVPPTACDFTVSAGDVAGLISAMESVISLYGTVDPPDTICLDEGTYTLTAVHTTYNGENGLPLVTVPMTIRGLDSGAILERDSTAPAFRFFFVGLDVPGGLTLENLTLMNGEASGTTVAGYGGAIYDIWGLLTLTDTTFLNNTASLGGAVYSTYDIAVTDSTFTGNSAAEGAAIYNNDSDSSVYNSCISGNVNLDPVGYSGIYSAAPNMVATNNWWGAVDGPSGAGPGSGDAVNSNVQFTPFLTAGCPN